MPTPHWPSAGRVALSQLGELFPSLVGVPGINPWNEDELLRWLFSGAPTSGSREAALFLLGVYNGTTDWTAFAKGEGLLPAKAPADALRFDLFHAMGVWDARHVEAFLAWIDAPFWP